MPRVAGQIDLAKSEAILDAAAEVFAERGLASGMDDVARRAGVSKQTIYNHFGSKADLLRALGGRRMRQLTAPLDTPGAAENLQETLAAYGKALLAGVIDPRYRTFIRIIILGMANMPELGAALYEAGIQAGRARLAEFLRMENAAGRLDAPDPQQAAEFFSSMVIGPIPMEALMGKARTFSQQDVDALAEECAARFLRAYAPTSRR